MSPANDRARSSFETQQPQRYAVLVNPHSAGGTTAREWRKIEPAVRDRIGDYTLLKTSRVGEATDLVREALRNGHDRIISAGGDGTHYEVVNGFFDGETAINPAASMAFLPLGTGSDFRKTLQIPRGRAAVPFLDGDQVVVSDLGRLHVTPMDGGSPVVCHFLNSVHTGLGGKVGEFVNDHSKKLGGFLTFLLAVVISRVRYRAQHMDIESEGRAFHQPCLDVICANGQYDGGGMHMAPQATLNSGWLEVSIIGNVSLLGTVTSLHLLYLGKQGRHPKVECFRARRMTITAPEKVLVSPDGELAGQTPVTIEIVPGAIRLVTGPEPPVA